MPTPTIGRTVGHGAIAGAVAGSTGAAVMYLLVEPVIRSALGIEAANEAAETAAGHASMSEEVVTRGEQVVFGLLTAVVVATFIGIAFALVHRYLGRRITGSDLPGSSLRLAGLGFVALTLAPAIVIPANPPSVGDPSTVDIRTTTYVGTILCAVALTSLVVGAARARSLAPRTRMLAASALGIASVLLLRFAVPNVSDPIPADVPADLIWRFRVGSLAELGVMWIVMAAVYGWLATGAAQKQAAGRPERSGVLSVAPGRSGS